MAVEAVRSATTGAVGAGPSLGSPLQEAKFMFVQSRLVSKVARFSRQNRLAGALQVVEDTESLHLNTVEHTLGYLKICFSQLLVNALVVDVE